MTLLLIILLILVIWCMNSAPAADFYAQHIYPSLSSLLSRIASPFGFSLTELTILVLILAFIGIIVRSVRRKWSFWKCIRKEIRLFAWVFVWFYAAWGINYYRSDVYTRLGGVPMPYEEAEFQVFLDEFAEQLNTSWTEVGSVDRTAVENHVKSWYEALPAEAGLCRPRSWQHPKRLLLNRLYSAVGVMGFVGPFFDEMHVNRDVSPQEYPFIFAHEYAHVLGVSNEAEANFWAFENCRHADDPAIRYAAWYMLLTYSADNIRSLLGEEAFQAWAEKLTPGVKVDLELAQFHWQELRWDPLARLQRRFYHFFLRSNRIADGTKNYGQVLRLVLTFSDLHDHEDGQEG